jgi:sorting nexin-8
LKDLPEPSLQSLATAAPVKASTPSANNYSQVPERPKTPPANLTPSASPARVRNIRKESLTFPEADPWGSPALHKGHAHTNDARSPPKTNGATSSQGSVVGPSIPSRTTSNFTTNSYEPPMNVASPSSTSASNPGLSSTGGGESWGSYGGMSGSGFPLPRDSGLGGDGFGDAGGGGDGNRGSTLLGRSIGGGRIGVSGVQETVTITVLPEKEGLFMFQHRNYQVASVRRGSKVVRRYSDFVWLLDCLYKRYPFRQLPLLPPKRLAGKFSFSPLSRGR